MLVSIVILSKNGGQLFQESLDAIFKQDTSFDYEVIVVDSGSTDSTLDVLKHYPLQLYSIDPESFFFGPARDFGFSLSKGEYVVTISQDVVPAVSRWLNNLVAPLMEDRADLVQGKDILPQTGDIFFWEKQGLFYRSIIGRDFIRQYGGFGVSCTNMAIKRSVWERVRFGDAPMNEDKEIQKRLVSKGYRIFFQPDALAFHGHQYSLRSLMKRCENEGMGWRRVGVQYSWKDMLEDIISNRWFYAVLWAGIKQGDVAHAAELLFPLIRPLYLYKGNLLNTNLKK